MRPRQATTVQPLSDSDTSVGCGSPSAEWARAGAYTDSHLERLNHVTCELPNLLVLRAPVRVNHLKRDGDFPNVIEPLPADTARSREVTAEGQPCR